jgi:hypothetical protein
MSFNFVADQVIQGKAYPALAKWPAQPYTPEWRQFGQHWPHTVPVNLHDHCVKHLYPVQLYSITEFPPGSFYTIAPEFFNFSIDYIGLLSEVVKQHVKNKTLRLLFYYDEGDNPQRIKQRLDQLCQQHSLPSNCYQFISANTAADNIKNFVYFVGDELLYWERNCNEPATPVHSRARSRDFTVLNRTHKWWRATVVADLYSRGLLANSFWSYNTQVKLEDSRSDNPIETGDIFDCYVDNFIANGPYRCDELTADEHNDHSRLVVEHYAESYCSIVMETHFDVDRSGGSFLTEKTFKCFKHGHPFVLVGAPGSLAQLRSLGYRTFDHAIDPSYDSIKNNTQRWIQLAKTIAELKSKDLHSWFETCRADIEHNQQVFLESKYNRLNTLHDKLLHQLATP